MHEMIDQNSIMGGKFGEHRNSFLATDHNYNFWYSDVPVKQTML